MSKTLSEMTLNELWELFPISLTEHNKNWKKQFDDEKQIIETAISEYGICSINHIGSTAINGIMAKNIVDILMEINENESIFSVAHKLEQNGYIIMSASEQRISLNKGYTESGFADKVFHLHIRFEGDNDELYFRDYLNAHRDAALDYQTLKMKLCEKYKYNRDEYTKAKSDFVKHYTMKAKEEFEGKYYRNTEEI